MKKYIAFLMLGLGLMTLSACCTQAPAVAAYPSFSKVAYYPYDGAVYPKYSCYAPCLTDPSYSPVYIRTHGTTYMHYNNVRYYP